MWDDVIVLELPTLFSWRGQTQCSRPWPDLMEFLRHFCLNCGTRLALLLSLQRVLIQRTTAWGAFSFANALCCPDLLCTGWLRAQALPVEPLYFGYTCQNSSQVDLRRLISKPTKIFAALLHCNELAPIRACLNRGLLLAEPMDQGTVDQYKETCSGPTGDRIGAKTSIYLCFDRETLASWFWYLIIR